MRANKTLMEIYADQLAGKLDDKESKLPGATPIIALDQTAVQFVAQQATGSSKQSSSPEPPVEVEQQLKHRA